MCSPSVRQRQPLLSFLFPESFLRLGRYTLRLLLSHTSTTVPRFDFFCLSRTKQSRTVESKK